MIRKLIESIEKYDDEITENADEFTILKIKISGDCVNSFREFIEEVSRSADIGAGTELKAISGEGEVASCYIDGDGADRISIENED